MGNTRKPEPPFTLEFAAALLAECKARGLHLTISAERIFIADPSKVDNEPRFYTRRQAAALMEGDGTKDSARTPGVIAATVKAMKKPPARAGGRKPTLDQRPAYLSTRQASVERL